MRRPHFTLRTLFVAMLVVAAFFGGIHFERERRVREERAAKDVARERSANVLKQITETLSRQANEALSRPKQPKNPPGSVPSRGPHER